MVGNDPRTLDLEAVIVLFVNDGSTPKTLLTAGAGFYAGSPKDLMVCACQLVCNILTNLGMAACNIQTLLAQGAQFNQLDDMQLKTCLCQLLCNLTVSVGAGGGLSGTGSPQGSVSAAPGVTYLDTSTGNFWAKQTGTGASGWLELIGN